VVLVSTGGIARTATETGFTLLTRLARADAAESRGR